MAIGFNRRTLNEGNRWLNFVLALFLGLALLIPLAWMLSTSVKSLDQVFAIPIIWVPETFHWENFPAAWSRAPFFQYTINSLIMTIGTTVLTVVFCCLAGYALAKFHFVGRGVIFALVLSTLMLPDDVLMVPTFLVVKDLGWLNSYQGLIIPLVADAFGVFLMRQFILHIPDSLLEAARIDGASEIRTLFGIVLPLVWPAMLTLALFTWRGTWDNFTWPFLIATDDSVRTIPIGLQRFNSEYLTTYNEVMAIATISMIPVILMLMFFQRQFMQGITMSGFKD